MEQIKYNLRMEQFTEIAAEAATDEPAFPSTLPAIPGARVSDSLTLHFEGALEAAVQPGSGRAARHDGWTPDRIRSFLGTLAQTGSVTVAAKAAGMAVQSAYRFRNRADGRLFHLAWEGALRLARPRLVDEALSRAIHGCVELIVRDGKVWGERHRFDNRLLMSVIGRLDLKAVQSDRENENARIVAEEFDQFVDIVCAGDGDAGAEFLALRHRGGYGVGAEGKLLGRLENYRRYQVGHPDEIDVSDLDPEQMASWSEEQAERAERSGLLEQIAEEEDEEDQDEEEGDDDSGPYDWSEDDDGALRLEDGTRILSDGNVHLPDGTELRWTHGQGWQEEEPDEWEEEDEPEPAAAPSAGDSMFKDG